jgi:hypothetical protein
MNNVKLLASGVVDNGFGSLQMFVTGLNFCLS